ncbi:MAG: hypothetical protein ACTSVC_15750 [Promethearchaeota archaeon]
MSVLYKIYRKKGCLETLQVLYDAEKHELKQNEFFKRLINYGSYLNAFFRVKSDLLKYGVIKYKLDEEYDKVVELTPKGVTLFEKILELDKFLREKIEGKSDSTEKSDDVKNKESDSDSSAKKKSEKEIEETPAQIEMKSK